MLYIHKIQGNVLQHRNEFRQAITREKVIQAVKKKVAAPDFRNSSEFSLRPKKIQNSLGLVLYGRRWKKKKSLQKIDLLRRCLN